MLPTATLKRLLPTRQVCLRYGVSSRTVRRWEIKKVIPPPDLVVNERKYWRESTLDENDRRIVATRGASAK
jgi:DNA-binding transcriptional MerR regulator